MTPIVKEIQELKQLPTSELVARYEALWGKEPRSKNRDHLWRRCAWKLQEQALRGPQPSGGGPHRRDRRRDEAAASRARESDHAARQPSFHSGSQERVVVVAMSSDSQAQGVLNRFPRPSIL